MNSRVILLIILNLMIVSSTFSQKKKKSSDKSNTLFMLDNSFVTTDEFIYLFSKNHQKAGEGNSKKEVEEYLNLYINFKLKVTEAKKRGMDTTKVFRDEFESYKKELIKPYLPDNKIIDSLVSLTYKRLQEEVRASHLLINVKPDAAPEDTLAAYNQILALKKRAESGESFTSLASLYSNDPSAKTNGGDLGYFTALQMVYPFENGAYTTPVGSVGGPFRTRFGYHLIKVTDRKPARGEVEVSHIMIRTDGKDSVKVKNQIFEVYDMLIANAKWEELCSQYSEDQSTKDKGGRLRAFGVGAMNGVPEFDRVAFSMKNPGDISDPFRTNFGWHIIRLEKKISMQSYEQMQPQLKSHVAKDERLQVSKEFVRRKYMKEFSFTENNAAKNNLFQFADSTLTTGKWDVSRFASQGKESLFSLKGKNFTVQSFLEYVKTNQRPFNGKPFDALTHLYDNFTDACIMVLVEEQIAKQNPDFALLTKEYYEGILLFNIMELEVWNKAAQDSAGQMKYYESNAGKYTAGERVKGIFYSSANANFRDGLKQLIDRNDSVAIENYIREKELRVESGNFEKADRAILSQIEWRKGIYFCENNGMYYLARILDTLPPGNKTFDECRAQVITDYQNDLEQEWIKKLKQKYPVKINEKGKTYVLEKLQQ